MRTCVLVVVWIKCKICSDNPRLCRHWRAWWHDRMAKSTSNLLPSRHLSWQSCFAHCVTVSTLCSCQSYLRLTFGWLVTNWVDLSTVCLIATCFSIVFWQILQSQIVSIFDWLEKESFRQHVSSRSCLISTLEEYSIWVLIGGQRLLIALLCFRMQQLSSLTNCSN